MNIFFHTILDFIFPPSPQEIAVRNLTIDELIKEAPKSAQSEFPFIKSLFSYKDTLIRELVWQIKYKKNKHAIRCAAFSLASVISEPTLLIPIPISKKRRKERGYNQCELLINEMINQDTNNKFTTNFTLLIRSKDIEKQTFKNRSERLKNTKNIFEVVDKVNLNQKIIIVDDVSTTGSTLKEAREELLKEGYSNVQCLTLAH
jgi:competence protein ComFC